MTTANRDKLLDFLRTGPKTSQEVAAHMDMKYTTATTALSRAAERNLVRIRRANGRNMYEVKS